MRRGRVIHCGAHASERGCGRCRRCIEKAASAARLTSVEPLPTTPQYLMPSFSLNPKPSRPGASAREQNIDQLLDKVLGVGRPRR